MVCHRIALLLLATFVASRAPSAEPSLEVEFAEKLGWGMIGGSVVLAILTALAI